MSLEQLTLHFYYVVWKSIFSSGRNQFKMWLSTQRNQLSV